MKDGKFINKPLKQVLLFAENENVSVMVHIAKLYGSSNNDTGLVLDPDRTKFLLGEDRGRKVTVIGKYIESENEIWIHEFN